MSKWDLLRVESLQVEHEVAEDRLRQMLADGELSRDDCVRRPGDDRWWRVYERAEFRVDQEDAAALAAEEEPPRLEAGSLRGLLVDAEPVSEENHAKPRPVVAPVARVSPAKPVAPPPPRRPEPQPPDDGDSFLPPKKPLTEVEDIDMAPACTVSFLLILFFVIVSCVALQMAIAFPKPAPDENAPAAQPPKTPEELKKDNLIVDIKADNTIWIEKEQIKSADLVTKLTNMKRDKAITDLVVNAEEAAYHQTVVAVFDAATQAGIQHVKMAAVTKVLKKASKKRAIKN